VRAQGPDREHHRGRGAARAGAADGGDRADGVRGGGDRGGDRDDGGGGGDRGARGARAQPGAVPGGAAGDRGGREHDGAGGDRRCGRGGGGADRGDARAGHSLRDVHGEHDRPGQAGGFHHGRQQGVGVRAAHRGDRVLERAARHGRGGGRGAGDDAHGGGERRLDHHRGPGVHRGVLR